MEDKDQKNNVWVNGLALLVTGFCVGGLMGLSVTPTIQSVLTSVLVVVIGITSILAGISTSRETSQDTTLAKFPVHPLPVMMLMAGILIGSCLGVYARTNLWLGPNGTALEARTGVSAKEINKRALEQLYPPPPTPGAGASESRGTTPSSQQSVAALFGVEIKESECEELRSLEGEALRTTLRQQDDLKVRALAERTTDNKALKSIVEEILCAKSK